MSGQFSRIVANITHELKTPLHTILAVVNLLENQIDGPLNDEQQKQVAIVKRNGEELLKLITSLLQLSSSTSEKPKIKRIKLKTFFKDLADSFQAQAAKNNITLDAHFEFAGANDYFSDSGLLSRILNNLLSNCLKFTPEGGKVSLFAKLGADALHVEISDTGVGMSPSTVKQIFNDFYQADSSDSRKFGGVGLGLALVKNALIALQGKIDVKSEEGHGSLFTLYLPNLEAEASAKEVFVLETESIIQTTFRECFKPEKITPSFFGSTDELRKAIAESAPDLLIISLDIDKKGILAFIKELRISNATAELPIIVISSFDSPDDRGQAFEVGADDYILKPFNVKELLARVSAQVNN